MSEYIKIVIGDGDYRATSWKKTLHKRQKKKKKVKPASTNKSQLKLAGSALLLVLSRHLKQSRWDEMGVEKRKADKGKEMM